MTSLRWLTRAEIEAIHHQQVLQFGGSVGLRDEGLLESVTARAQNLAAYGEPNSVELAAAYAFDIARNHPFVDGNKRTALMAAFVFLGLHGKLLSADEAEAALIFRDLAAGEVDEATLAAWIGAHIEAR